MFVFSYLSAKLKYYDNSNKLFIGWIKNQIGCIANEEPVRLKPKIYLFLVHYSSEHKKENGVNKIVVARISHNE